MPDVEKFVIAVERLVTQLRTQPQRTHYSVEEVAIAMNMTDKQVYGAIERGEIKAKKFGRDWRINVEQLKSL